MRLKRWESPRRQGRNHKGKGGAARKRQLKKQQQMLRKRLKQDNKQDKHKNNKQGEDKFIFSLFLTNFNLYTNTVSLMLFVYINILTSNDVNQYTCIISTFNILLRTY